MENAISLVGFLLFCRFDRVVKSMGIQMCVVALTLQEKPTINEAIFIHYNNKRRA